MTRRTKERIKLAVSMIILVACVLLAGYVETRYTRTDCEVLEVWEDHVTVEDTCGYKWSYYVEDEAPRVGDRVTLKMHTNHTDNIINDDMVIGVEPQE